MYDFVYLTSSTMSGLESMVETYYNNGYTPVGNIVNIVGTYVQGMQSSQEDISGADINSLPDPEGNNNNLLSRVWRMRHMDIGFVTSSQLSSNEITSLGL